MFWGLGFVLNMATHLIADRCDMPDMLEPKRKWGSSVKEEAEQ